MKKILVYSLTAAILFGSSFAAFAQTSTTSGTVTQLQALIETLKKQAADLQVKFEAQQKAAADLRSAAQDVQGTLNIIRGLKQGMSGDEIKALQTILAADPEIYPEGKITGFFGTLTAKAVKRFQKKHELDQIGDVGPKTLEKLNKELQKNPLAEENASSSDGHEGKRLCAIVPPGHLIAPGWLRKHEKPVVPPCQVLPPGIIRLLGGATSTPPTATSTDTTAPVISGVSAINIASSSAHIVWTTDEAATSKVWYSASTPVVATGTTPMVASVSLVTAHDIMLSSLNASTTYHFVAESSDAAGNKAVGGESSFITTP